ncbi:thiaminase II [Levilactobacillus bambusae]|uniref:Aminopyrimidine aminohydrolase n=1 Tax=Levilactobacillus bambusae TaxID=2024736 RepID=A0A2V1MYN1_9LACO|nr:thiaminase II [Levilactobacillus bambusae]PWG00079.1 thiaminase II [Levilactobacillus bambusae]
MLFTVQAHKATEAIWQASKDHPFIKQLQAGTLPIETFRFYLLQDRYYLEQFANIHEQAAHQARVPEVAQLLSKGAEGLREGEIATRKTYFSQLGITAKEVEQTPVAPTAYNYTSHMYRALLLDGVSGAVACLLPCYWLYAEVGQTLKSTGSPNPLYQQWIDDYTSEDYTSSMTSQLQLVNRLADQADQLTYQHMLQAFKISSLYELDFWQMALDHEQWPLVQS